jgi:hypothetical protein
LGVGFAVVLAADVAAVAVEAVAFFGPLLV